MKAAIITIGTELTDGRVLDTNTGFIARDLDGRGFNVILTASVPDDRLQIGQSLNFALQKHPDLVVLAGGLGPTEDDLTAAAVAAALGLELELNQAAAAMVKQAVAAEGDLAAHEAKQATMPAGSYPLQPAGTAPGFVIRIGGAAIIALPGVPHELKTMWSGALSAPGVVPIVNAARPPFRGRLSFFGVREVEVDDAVEAIVGKAQAGLEVSICSRRGEVLLEVIGRGGYLEQIQSLIETLKESFKDSVFSEGEEIEAVVAAMLKQAHATLAVGESCTGGMLGERITTVAGASDFFLGGVTAYRNEVKKSMLKVRQEVLDNAGAVSRPVAQQLALGVRAATGADYGIGITGIAGPSGGTPEKPVGLVYICVSSEERDVIERFHFKGGREDIREASVTAALHMLRGKLAAELFGSGPDETPAAGGA